MDFRIVATTDRVQTATMTLDPGEVSGAYGNEHAGSTQVLVVLEGEVAGAIGERKVHLREGESVIVRRGELHQFRNDSPDRVITFNVYVPPAY